MEAHLGKANACKILVKDPEGRRPLRWKDNIKIGLREID
jgi:hypothetical protein